MHIKKVKTKNDISYYLCSSYRDSKTGKPTSKIVENLGSKADIQKRIGKSKNVDKWVSEYAKKRTQEEKNANKQISLNVSPHKKIKKGDRQLYNVGYYAIQNVCYEIGLDKILNKVAKDSGFKGNLFQIVSSMIYNRIINAFDGMNTYDYSRSFVYPPKFTKQQLYRAIDVLSAYAVPIQYDMYKNMKPFRNKAKTIYFDRQSFIFDLEQSTFNDKWLRKNNLLVDYEVTLDNDGLPLAFNLPNKYIDVKSKYYAELQKTIKDDFSNLEMIVFNILPEEDLAKKLNEKFDNCLYVEDQEISGLPNDTKKWIVEPDNWNMVDSSSVYNLDDVKEKLTSSKSSYATYRKYYNASFYKNKKIKFINKKTGQVEDKTLIIFFNYELRQMHAEKRMSKILNIKNTIDKNIAKNLDNIDNAFSSLLNKYSKILSANKDSNDEIKRKYNFKEDVFSYGKEFDGYYALIADIGNYDIENIIKLHSSRWQIHQPFESVNTEFQYNPQYISLEKSVGAHFLICTIMVLVWRMYISRFKSKSYSWEIANTLRSMNYLEIPGVGWLPAYEHNDITKHINDVSKLDIDYEFITAEKMRKIAKN